MIYEDCWIPELFPCSDLSKWEEYENEAYRIFKADFIDSHPSFMEKKVQIRRHPIEYEKEEAFWHVTCCDFNKTKDRTPDLRRCERIRWVRAFIENHLCNKLECPECEGVLVWGTIYPKSKKPRYKILLEEERYVVIVEERDNYCLLITAYYIEHDSMLRKLRNEYQKASLKQEAPR